ncbi:YqiA/YcfP family alpha/beta fold hydrolase [Cupriavidus consociatus]|uniref:YqiA/YcfP family alpha/beta fold hydrolase n=1 Tax=Cupriavidus consociatus TaxID=2821357 RepID=UPI001AE5392F|nr:MULTISPECIES: YqiA/YcfP family alpha/beta fold hydrolase [unclassified Cupriavidus]MBP0624607.1 esterase [Cupriavidus sp. LEh25]MDK2661319.1 YqiA/YcfP family alpha/beta fold hydrolase [Cupriavidus sp. LEh21]
MLLYLHGFRSSPQSFKARLVQERMREWGVGRYYACPELNVSPALAIAQAEAAIRAAQAGGAQEVAIMGSSLGGFYARWLGERHGCKTVLLNPAVHPWTDLEQYLGEQPLWHGGGSVTVERRHLQELLNLRVNAITRPERYYLLAATGDEVLDYREMVAACSGANIRVIEGSDHGISEFADYVDEVLAFCGYGPGGKVPKVPAGAGAA